MNVGPPHMQDAMRYGSSSAPGLGQRLRQSQQQQQQQQRSPSTTSLRGGGLRGSGSLGRPTVSWR
jgi:hypothetical protein